MQFPSAKNDEQLYNCWTVDLSNLMMMMMMMIMLCCFVAVAMNDGVLHPHCDSCIRRKCTVVTDPPCPVISCSSFCGAAFHECKASEHKELCPLQKVPCINVESGCPMVLRRCDLGRHLASCPASVICCTMEWCRWPMFSRERGIRVPFAPTNLRARCGQLDVALALRDQRTLDKAKRFPRRSLVRALRNSFTKRYPAVPLLVGGNPTFIGDDDGNSQDFVFSDSDDEEDLVYSRAPWLTAKEPPGLQKSILSELFCELPVKSGAHGRISKLVAEDVQEVRCALCLKANGESPANRTKYPVATCEAVSESPVCSSVDAEEDGPVSGKVHHQELEKSSLLISEGNKTLGELGVISADSSDMQDCALCAKGSDCQPFEENSSADSIVRDSCSNDRRIMVDEVQNENGIDQISGDNRDMDGDICSHDGHIPICDKGISRSALHLTDTSSVLDSLGAYPDSEAKEKEIGNKIDNAALSGTASAVGSGRCSLAENLPCPEQCSTECAPLTLHEVLAVDLNIEVSSRYHIHDPSLYSFICAQLFRRDEYVRHVRDVHSVIHDAIAHWLEVRCPLAHCGCTFSMHQRLPSGSNVIFSPLQESFGLRPKANNDCASKEPLVPTESRAMISSQIPTVQDVPWATAVEMKNVHLKSTDAESSKPPLASVNQLKECSPGMFAREFDSAVSVPSQFSSEAAATEGSNTSSVNDRCADDNFYAKRSRVVCENRYKECTPEIFTSREFDSAVCIRPRTSKEPTPNEDSEILCLTDLPFELLVRIATYLDSFSVCNLSLTSWLMRDVCRALVRQRGLVVLEWQRDCSRNPPRWKISHQVSLFILSANICMVTPL